MIKPVAVLPFLVLIPFLRSKQAAAYIFGAACPFFPVAVYLAFFNLWEQAFYALVTFNSEYARANFVSFSHQIQLLLKLPAALSPALAVFPLSAALLLRYRRKEAGVLLLWTIAQIAITRLTFYWTPHYFFPIAACLALILAGTGQTRRGLLLATLLIAIALWRPTGEISELWRGLTPPQISKKLYGYKNTPFWDAQQLADQLQGVPSLHVFKNESHVYALTKTKSPSRYFYAPSFVLPRDYEKVVFEALITNPPNVIVLPADDAGNEKKFLGAYRYIRGATVGILSAIFRTSWPWENPNVEWEGFSSWGGEAAKLGERGLQATLISSSLSPGAKVDIYRKEAVSLPAVIRVETQLLPQSGDGTAAILALGSGNREVNLRQMYRDNAYRVELLELKAGEVSKEIVIKTAGGPELLVLVAAKEWVAGYVDSGEGLRFIDCIRTALQGEVEVRLSAQSLIHKADVAAMFYRFGAFPDPLPHPCINSQE